MEVILQEVKPESQPQVIVPDLHVVGGSDVHSHSLSKISLGKNKTIITSTKHSSSIISPVSIVSSQKISTITQNHTGAAVTSTPHLLTNSTPTVIQSPSVIQSAAGQLLSKNLILVSSKNNSVIQTTGGAIQAVQVLQAHPNTDDEESLSNDGVISPENIRTADKKRREILTRRPSYRKILNDLGGADSTEITGDKPVDTTSESSQDADGSLVLNQGQYSSVKVINANNLGLGQATTAEGTGVPAAALQTITMTNAGTAGGTIVQYAHQDGQQFFVPVGSEIQAYTIRPVSSASSSPGVMSSGGGMGGHSGTGEEATRKREIRLLKNREAARECRRKKKEYIKCLENRVAVLENQNKALIDELKSLKELYCQQKND